MIQGKSAAAESVQCDHRWGVGFIHLLLAFWVRFFCCGEISVPFPTMSIWASPGPHPPLHIRLLWPLRVLPQKRLYQELGRLCTANVLDMALLQTFLFMFKEVPSPAGRWSFLPAEHRSSWEPSAFLRYLLRYYRQKGYNLKHVLIVGQAPWPGAIWTKIRADKELGYHPMGYVSDRTGWKGLDRLGGYAELDRVLGSTVRRGGCAIPRKNSAEPRPSSPPVKGGRQTLHDPVLRRIYALQPSVRRPGRPPSHEYPAYPPGQLGQRLSQAVHGPGGLTASHRSHLPGDALRGHRGSKLSSPGPSSSARSGSGRIKALSMYKFRSMRVNGGQDTGWSRDHDDRKIQIRRLDP